MTREERYNMPPKGLFGKRCRIKHCSNLEKGFVYRIVNDGVLSNTWRELPLGRFGKEPVIHDTFEEVVFVVCDTLIDESSKIEKVALKDIEIIEEELSDDCISRQAVLDATVKKNSIWNSITNSKGENLEEIISQLPPVNPQKPICPSAGVDCEDCPAYEPKTGHWVFDEVLDRHYYCSECKSMGVNYWDYCPYCGAKMVEPQESEKINCKTTKCENCQNHNYCDYEPQESEEKPKSEWEHDQRCLTM